MPTLYVTQPGATVRVLEGHFCVTSAPESGNSTASSRGNVLLEVKPHRLEWIGVVGRVHVTRDALSLCLEKGISIAWYTWGGDFQGRLTPKNARSGDLRLAQMRMALDASSSLAMARRIIAAKCGHAAEVLRRIQSNQPGLLDLAMVLKDMGQWEQRIVAAVDAESLLGYEGGASKSYFSVLRHGFRGDIPFLGRQRRPPPDPANALLSFGYVLLGNRLAGLLEGRGLDPAVGFFHVPRPGRASLSLDLLEEFRHAVVDRFVMRTCNLRTLRRDMFEADPESGGVRLTRDGLKIFFTAWGNYLERPITLAGGEKLTINELLRHQVNNLAMAIRGEREYQPFRLDGQGEGE